MKTAVIAQARTGSSRLPGKVLKPLCSRPIIEHVLLRAHAAKNIDAICVATTIEKSDDAIAEIAERLGIPVFRGSEVDVLSRYVSAAEMINADVVIRITCDCPLIDPAVIDSVVTLREQKNADYASNGGALDWPHGLDCEVFTRAMLDSAANSARDPYDREHVTPWIRNHGAQTTCYLPGPGKPVSDQRWVVDYPEDYEFLCRLFAFFPEKRPPLTWQEIWAVAQQHPELSAINAHLRRQALPR
jgi:spore coat polysaccharide biosynthesis protein SpsF (cytidylyltransferase family)